MKELKLTEEEGSFLVQAIKDSRELNSGDSNATQVLNQLLEQVAHQLNYDQRKQ